MEAQKIRIRQAVDSDARGIARVHIDSWRATYSGIVPAEHLAGLDYDEREARWHRILADRRQNAFVAEAADGRIVGFASGGPERSGDAAYPGELYAIYIDKSLQRQGLGRRLVAALGGWFLSRSWQSMLLWVLAENPSRGFYEALGGTEVRQETITIGGTELVEIAYGWSDISPLATRSSSTGEAWKGDGASPQRGSSDRNAEEHLSPSGMGLEDTMNYPVVIHKDADSDYGVTVPDLPGCFSAAGTMDDALANAVEAITTHVEGLLLDGEPIPEPNKIESHRDNPDYGDGIWAVVTVDLSRVRGKAQRINVTIPERILSRVDDYAKETGDSRSGLMAAALLEYISQRPEKEVI